MNTGPQTDPRDLAQPLALAQALIRCASVTPKDEGALDVLQRALESLGFACHRLPFSQAGTADVDNLYARLGQEGSNFCFGGHTDVVPTGDLKGWTVDPFAGEVIDGFLYGRGAADMKGAIAAFVAAATRFKAQHGGKIPGSISLLITGDEEAYAINGTVKVLDWLKARGEKLDACIVGEPTNPTKLGEMMKVGRRGSLVGYLTVFGTQGHTAYPHLADNPVPRMLNMLSAITEHKLDDGTEHFQPSTLEISTVDVGNPASNVIPAQVSATFNIRFSDKHSSASLIKWLEQTFARLHREAGGKGSYEFKTHITGESFLCPPGEWTELVADAIEQATGRAPDRSTTGGTSDARFIFRHCPVVEFGLIGQTMHKADERTAVADMDKLADIYLACLERFFTRQAA
jgi:succinyl-diaminopimelate desuccinylase